MRGRVVKIILKAMLSASMLLAATMALATYHTFRIEQIFSNADGSVQYVVLHEALGMDGQNLFAGQTISSGVAGTTKTYVFPSNLPGGSCDYYGCSPGPTANKRVLIATQGFAALNLVAPDYVVENGFLPLANGSVNFAGVSDLPYASLPTDGVNALYANGMVAPNLATNFAGQSASVASAALDLNQHGLTGSWYEPATRGQGFEVEVFPDLSAPGTGFVFVSWFTYDTVVGAAERQRWYTLSGQVVTGQPSAALTIRQNTGGNFNAPPITTGQPVGTATLTFDTCTSGQLSYSFTDGTGRTGNIPLTRLTQNVTCSTSSARPTNADFALSGNWFDPATSGQGLTVEVNPTSGTIFAAWYTYAPNGASAGAAGQRWYTAQPDAAIVAGHPVDPGDDQGDHRRIV